jgi:hypothetical protein
MTQDVLIIDERRRRKIAKAIERARAKPVPVQTIVASGYPAHEVGNLSLADRKPGFERPPSEHIMLGTYRVAFSFEEQPGGMCAHLSASSPDPGKVPGPDVLDALLREFGFAGNFRNPHDCLIWLEEFDPGHRAVNVVWVVSKNAVGHA